MKGIAQEQQRVPMSRDAAGTSTCATCLILLASCTLAFGAETAAERGKRVVDEALRALGGDAFLHMQDRVESGRGYGFYREELSGLAVVKIYTRYLAPVPGQIAVQERDAQGKKEDSVVLFTENGAWEVTYRGARPLTDLRYANYKDSTLRNIFYILRQRLDEPGLAFYSQGMDMYENRPVEIVDITDAANSTVKVYFDQLTKLPTRQAFKRRNPDYKDFDTEVTIFSKYRDVGGGVQWPCATRRERNGEKILEVYSDSVVINHSLKDDLFSLPGNLKVLPQAK
jgi:hypothetical protein